MACYNAERFVSEAIQSIRSQTESSWELIVVDDHSTDGSLGIIKEHADQDGRIRVFRTAQNSGPAAARNLALSYATAEWIAVLDSDDVSEPDRLATQLRVASKDERIAIVGSNSWSITAEGAITNCHRYPTRDRALRRRLAGLGPFPAHSSLLYRRAWIPDQGFRNRFVPAEDLDLWVRLSEQGIIASIPQPLVRRRIHTDNISNWEGGDRQRRLGMAAAVCNALRLEGRQDPSEALPKEEWDLFVSWIEKRMDSMGYSAQRRAAERIAASSAQISPAWARKWHQGMVLVQSGHAGAILLQRVRRRTTMPSRLAREWLDLQS